jgi:hypothetical protein
MSPVGVSRAGTSKCEHCGAALRLLMRVQDVASPLRRTVTFWECNGCGHLNTKESRPDPRAGRLP